MVPVKIDKKEEEAIYILQFKRLAAALNPGATYNKQGDASVHGMHRNSRLI